MTNRASFPLAPEFSISGIIRSSTEGLINNQVKDSVVKQEKHSPKKMSSMGKISKPTMQIYQPPPKSVQKNGTKVHFQSPPVSKRSPTPPVNELKSALKRSKSFAGHDTAHITPVGFDKDTFPLEYQGLIRNAMLDPNSLSCRQLMELVRLICSKAVETTQNAAPAAQMCFAIIEKETAGTFLESLLNACREWYNERDKLLRNALSSPSGLTNSFSSSGSRRWTAYVSFLTELFLRLRSQHGQSVLHAMQKGGSNIMGDSSLLGGHHALSLTTLIYECAMIILKPPALNNPAEVECLRSMLTSIGSQFDRETPQRMQLIMSALRDAYINPSVTAQIRKTILELVELHASNWQLDLSQSMYYFPYTSIERR